MSEAESSMQVELDTGKRVKVKAANVLLRFAEPAPAELLSRARALSEEIDLNLAWEFAPEGDFGFADLARDYYDPKAGAVQQAAALIRLFEAPHYFRRMGKGQFRKASEETLKAALLGIERKKQVAAQIEQWAQELSEGSCPQPIREQLYRILFKPDKNAPEYKAVVEASRRSQRSPLDLLKGAGAIDSPYQFHWKRFLFEHFPKGSGFAKVQAPLVQDDLPLADGVQAFSIDDSSTTEIDDAISVRGLGSGTVVLGIHIAAPALAIAPGTPVDQIAVQRLSTVYMPGHKLTMLPDEVVQAYTLVEGRASPAVSLYVTLDEATLEIRDRSTRLERVHVQANLRHDKLEAHISEDTLLSTGEASLPFHRELAFSFRLAQHLKAQREVVRGKPENFNRPDFNFKLEGRDGTQEEPPHGGETVIISQRQRGSPLDLLVAELMILANSSWGAWLAELGVPGIYRSQASLAPGIKVRMGTKPAPHAGMGVSHYTWASSPLRRYVDLVNQWQVIACARHGRTAALAAPFKPKDAQLFSVVSSFDAAYTAYADFQRGIERYWTLRWLEQNGVNELPATVLKDGLVRAEELPLVFKVAGAEPLPRGTRLMARVQGVDLLTLDVHATLQARLDAEPQDHEASGGDDDDDLAQASAPLALAIDVEGGNEVDGAGEPVAPAASATP
ncbi:MAG: ribonuclease catalytic domain-containing protein [Burkholderiaceae bacterium]|jgi:exoribonuclease-2